MFKIIRLGGGYDPVIVVSPPDAGPDTPDAKFYRLASWQIGNHKPGVFNEIDGGVALSYFSGQADGMGLEVVPEEIFPSLEAIVDHVRPKREEWAKEFQKEHGVDPLDEESLRAEIRRPCIKQGIPLVEG